jgi:peptidoglycan LD-endopeptidase LytH
MVGKAAVCSLLLVAVLAIPPAGGSEQPAPGYLRPVSIDNAVFPVARSDWYSVINFQDDWHAPRLRKVGSAWVPAGFHEGNDIFAEPGTPILAMTPGTVENLGWLFYSGWRVGIRGEDGRYYFYAHMTRYATGMELGDHYSAGDVIGYVGNTGYGPAGHHDEFTYHLHLGIQESDGEWVNPYPLLRSLYRETVERQR